MAYVLGFFAADGCLTINPRGARYLEFSNTDRDVLVKIRAAMGSRHKISRRVRPQANWQDSWRIQIGSAAMFQDVQRLGFTIAKSQRIQLPRIPPPYFADFVRGFFDGDGSVALVRQGKRYAVLLRFICADIRFLQQLARAIQQQVRTRGQSIFYQSGAHVLAYATYDSLRIIRYLYRRPNGLWMNRKYRRCQAAQKCILGT